MSLATLAPQKFKNQLVTAKGEERAWVAPLKLTTLWFNTGTLCNLQCVNCYIESSPKNDSLIYISHAHVKTYLDEIEAEELGTTEIGFTGGEPFMNPEMIPILEECLSRGFDCLVLTNAMQPMQNKKEDIFSLKERYGNKLTFRISLDHYTEEKHAQERGKRAWPQAIKGLKFLSDNGFPFSIAGRSLSGETETEMRRGYQQCLASKEILFDASLPQKLILFPEMDETVDVPEITTACWDILKLDPNSLMCATSRMVIHRKGEDRPDVAACTLLPYQGEFRLGKTLKESLQRVYLNHPHCAKFCALGGGSCTG